MKLKFKRKTKPGHFPWAVNDREHAERIARIKIELREILTLDVDYGLYAAQQVLQLRASTRPSITGLTVALLFHRAVEMLDGIDALLAAGATLPARVLARAMLEAVVYSRYLSILNDDRVAAAYFSVAQLSTIERIRADAEAAHHAPGSRPTIELRKHEEAFRASIAEGRLWREAMRELERLHREEGPSASWYRAFNGPRTFGGVVKAIEKDSVDDFYGLFFDKWSQTVHCTDWAGTIAFEDHENVEAVSILLRPLRTVQKDANEIVTTCHTLFSIAMVTLIKYFKAPNDGFREWNDEARRLLDNAGIVAKTL